MEETLLGRPKATWASKNSEILGPCGGQQRVQLESWRKICRQPIVDVS